MSLLRRYRFVLMLGLVLGLVFSGRELVRPSDDEQAAASIERVAAVDDVPAAEPAAAAAPAESVEPDAPTPSAANIPSNSGTFRGRVIDATTRQPVREFDIAFHGSRSSQAESPGVRTFRTKDGRFEWPGIPPAVWVVAVSARGYQRFDINALPIATGEAKSEMILPLLRGYRLRGRVYDESSGDGIASADVRFRPSHLGRYKGNFRMRVSTHTKRDGSFVLDGLPPGGVILSVSSAKHMAREIDVFVGESMKALQIGLTTGGAVSGYLAAADGLTPVAGWVGLSSLDEGHGSAARTSDAGEFSYDHLPPGRYRLTGRSDSQNAQMEITLGKDERRVGIVLALGGGSSIRGVVTGVRPVDLERVRVSLYREGGFGDLQEVAVDANGAYQIGGVPPGQVTVRAVLPRSRQITKTVQVSPSADLTRAVHSWCRQFR
jgi:large repetitive protein